MIDYSKIKFHSVKTRDSKFSIHKKYKTDLDKVIKFYKKADFRVLMMGAHPIKQGMNRHIISLMKYGKLDLIAMNGAATIHDFEICAYGHTSEDVAENIQNGKFGFWKETGWRIRKALLKSNSYGSAMKSLCWAQKKGYRRHSLLASAHEYDIPVTVHVGIGTDITHQFLTGDDEEYFEAIGRGSGNDFKTFIELFYENLTSKSIVFNVACNTIMPEVFLKMISTIRNLGNDCDDFMAIVVDKENQYRPRNNVVLRPTKNGVYIQHRFNYVLPHIAKEMRAG